MATHEPVVKRMGDGVHGVCTCKHQQLPPVMTLQAAEDWCRHHLEQVRLAQADPGKQLSPQKYLEYLREMEGNADLPADQREGWRKLADEQERRVRLTVQPKMKGVPGSPNVKYDTGVETEPLF